MPSLFLGSLYEEEVYTCGKCKKQFSSKDSKRMKLLIRMHNKTEHASEKISAATMSTTETDVKKMV